MFGGRTEGFKSYYCCNTDQKIYYFDVVSLYPTVNALDPCAIGFKKYVDFPDVTSGVDALMNDKFFGLMKVDITPPKNLRIPLIPENRDGKLLFHLEPMVGKTWTSLELKKAIEKKYVITKIYSALSYPKMDGLM